MQPALCPLCRKPFLPDRAKKLITGEKEGPDDEEALDLVKKLVETVDSTNDIRELIVAEVEQWLSAGNTSVILQKSYGVLNELLILRMERDMNLRSIRRLQSDMHRLQVDQSREKENASLTERRLHSQVLELQLKASYGHVAYRQLTIY
ncbi:hypothetical protein C0991_007774 [Blastosporella zonata]|nr:hypothetical protein C0991_007774 [Blastosporella zonata]